jgi:hypothetical protein
MSSRQLRKLQQQRELEQAQAKLQAEADEDESEDEPIASAPKSKGSVFANLAALQDEGEDEDEDEEEAAQSQQELSVPEQNPAPAPKPKKSKKKKKAKNRTKDKVAEEDKPENGADEIDAALRELNIRQASKPFAASQPALDPEYERVCKLLGVNSQRLKVANEMRNLFGRTAVDNHDDAGGPVGRGARRRQRVRNQPVDLETALRGQHAPGKGLSELTLRRNSFIQGKDEWPKATTGGLTMSVTGLPTEDGIQEFKYEHDHNYQQIQQAFRAFVEMGDPQNLIGFLIRNRKSPSPFLEVLLLIKDSLSYFAPHPS